MHRIDSPNSVAGMFTDGDPTTGTLSTALWAKWHNSVQEELVAIVLSSGQALDTTGTNNTQVLAALNLLTSGRINQLFRPLPSLVPDMKIRLLAGYVYTDAVLTEVAEQSTIAFVAPATPNARIDRVVINRKTGALAVVQGVPSTSPVAPAIPSGSLPVARVVLTAGQTVINSVSIVDERALSALGLGEAAFADLGGNIVNQGGNLFAAGVIDVGECKISFRDYPSYPFTKYGAVWDKCDGGILLRAAWPACFAAIGTLWGAPDGSSFNKPPAGFFLRGLDWGSGNDPNAATRGIAATGATSTAPGSSGVGTVQADQNKAFSVPQIGEDFEYLAGAGGGPVSKVSTRSPFTNGGAEARPKNMGVNILIRLA